MTKKDEDRSLFDAIDSLVGIYDDNKETIRDYLDSGNEITIDDEDPLKEAYVEDDCVMVTVDVGTDKLKNVGLDLDGDVAKIHVGDKTLTANVPDDVIMDDAEANLNNGILEVLIPREGGEE